MITIEDLRDPKRKSGYRYVTDTRDASWPARAGKPFQARAGDAGLAWKGPRRDTAEEAAQDYCDYANGLEVSPASRARLASAAHPKATPTPRSKAVQVALDILRDERAKVVENGTVYLVAEKRSEYAVKIGWTSKTPPEARLNDYQAGNPRVLVMLGTLPGTKADEGALHRKYQHDNILGEWFRPTDELLSEFGLTTRKIKNAWRNS